MKSEDRLNLYVEICTYFNYRYPDSVLHFVPDGLALAKKLDDKKSEIILLSRAGEAYSSKSNYTKSLEIKLKALREAEALNDDFLIANCKNFMGAVYVKTEDWKEALEYYRQTILYPVYFEKYKKYVYGMTGVCLFNMEKFDSSFFYLSRAYDLDKKDKTHWTVPYFNMGNLAKINGEYVKALDYYREGDAVVSEENLDKLLGYKYMALVFKEMRQEDSSIYYAKKAVNGGIKRSLYAAVTDVSQLLVDYFTKINNKDSVLKYQSFILATKDSLYSQDKVKLIMKMTINEQRRSQQAEEARMKANEEYKTKLKFYGLLAGSAVALLIISILYRNNRQKQKTNSVLQKQKTEITNQRDNLDQALKDLRDTQSQLIQREKMASLGELTAGIAHEIQNPLNFVNNFSDVNAELIEDLKAEALSGNTTQVIVIANDLKSNEEKISHHGKRADSIVKGMLEHSRQSTAEKQPTDINSLVDEYLKLAYHGMRAKDKNFNVIMKTHFDNNIGKINIAPQEIGRVLLNLFNNAFYAVRPSDNPSGGYNPEVGVSTIRAGDKIIITVEDNGTGISENIKDKIFQPFFTTKPTGQGTGLGLSLTYDIVKAYGGEIRVETKEGEGSAFKILLPV